MTGLPFFTGKDAPEIEPIDWIVKDLLAKGAGTILFGQPGVSKTAHAAILVASLCLGKPFAGMQVNREYRVLYIDLDGGWNWTGELFRAAFRGNGNQDLPDSFLYWSPLTEQCQLGEGQTASLEFLGDAIEATVRKHKIDVVVVDSLGQFMAGDANSGQDVSLALRLGLNGARAAGAAVLVIDHATKAARTNTGVVVPTPTGSQQKRAWARVTVALEEEGESERLTRWSVDKSNSKHFAPFFTRLDFRNDTEGKLDSLSLELVGSAGARPTASGQSGAVAVAATILTALQEKGMVQRKEFGYGGTVDRVLKDLFQNGKIVKPKAGYYSLPTSPSTSPEESNNDDTTS
jgi:AAA domain